MSNARNVYDASLVRLGQLPENNDPLYVMGCHTDHAVISQDGTRAYAHCYSGASGRVYSYDLTAPTVSGYFPAIGSYISAPMLTNDMLVSSDGKALFFVDTSKVTVLQLP